MALDLSRLDQGPVLSRSRAVPPAAPVADFEEDPGQPRSEFDDDAAFAALVADIRQRGVLQPLVVRRMDSGRLRIRFGARRYRAALRAGLAVIPYVETEDERQFDDYAQVAENAHRQPLQPLELGCFIVRKLAAGETRRGVAARLDMDPSAVTHLLALAVAPPPLLLELYHSRRCRAPYYLYLLRKLMRRDAALVERRLEAVPHVDLATIEAMTEELRRKTALSRAGGPVSPSDAGSAALPAAARSARRRAGRRPAVGNGGAVRLFGYLDGRVLELMLMAPPAAGQAWVRYADEHAPQLVLLADIRLTVITAAGDAGEAPAANASGMLPP
ncbi:ParB/RepB/Spo0J family partition protein [Duganella levis]|uniref:ParB/RepB/Spo0J family partition protein n=1 Tax=Duganella levis TaxID=2692169 RepID=A0ABW9VT44_9BURK|nr:ParB/RepB/Spo0J family partition protein [Duganella levis]MYN24802.1 ParB/RepB/Spo0J family partition protein [Duganella levis]